MPNNAVCDFLYKSINSKINKGKYDLNHESFNVKHITECPRRISYRLYGFNPECNLVLQEKSLKYVKLKWVDLLSKCDGITIVKSNFIAADSNYNVHADIDAIIKIKGKVFVLLVDSMDEEKYKLYKKTGGSRSQISHIIASMWLTELSEGIILCENKITNQYFLSYVKLHNSILNAVKHKSQSMLTDKILQKIPDRPYKDDTAKECQICEYKSECWKK